jgi:hypothetical protein
LDADSGRHGHLGRDDSQRRDPSKALLFAAALFFSAASGPIPVLVFGTTEMARKILKIALPMVGILLAGAALVGFGISMIFGHRWRVAKAAHGQFHAGMTVQEIAAVFPTEFVSGSIAVPMRTEPCKLPNGKISPPEHSRMAFPKLPADDAEGIRLIEQADKMDSEIDDMERLDQHLREREEWKLLSNSWTTYIEYFLQPEFSQHLNPVAYLRRGTAYLELDDFTHGYGDLRTACQKKVKQACAAIMKLPQDQVAAWEAETRHAEETMASCEPVLNWYSLSGPVSDERFRLEVNVPEQKGTAKILLLSRTELAEMLGREFKGRYWIADFMFDSNDFRTFWFSFVVDREGKLKEVMPIRVQD